MTDYGQDVLTSTEELHGTWAYAGEEYDLKVEDVSYETYSLILDLAEVAFKARDGEVSDAEKERIKEMDNLPWEDEYETDDFVALLVKDKLIKPEVDVEDTGTSKIIALIKGMFATWQESKEVAEARDEMRLDEGNR
jgi:hypothetical protein